MQNEQQQPGGEKTSRGRCRLGLLSDEVDAKEVERNAESETANQSASEQEVSQLEMRAKDEESESEGIPERAL